MTAQQPAAPRRETDQPTSAPPRWWRYRKRGRLTCPDGHHFRDKQRFPESGFLRCDHWIADAHRECSRWVFAYAIRGGGCVVVEVQLREMDALEALSTPGEVVEYLGIFNDDDPPPRPSAAPTHQRRVQR